MSWNSYLGLCVLLGLAAGALGAPHACQLSTATQLAAGEGFLCATDGREVCCSGREPYSWGRKFKDSGRIYSVPGARGPILQLVAGDNHVCIRSRDGASCAGQRYLLGTASGAGSDGFVRVPGLRGIKKLVAGKGTTCALLPNGTARCWGYNGSLGSKFVSESSGAILEDSDAKYLFSPESADYLPIGRIACDTFFNLLKDLRELRT